MGASVRGAIDLVRLGLQLARAARRGRAGARRRRRSPTPPIAALSGRLRLEEGASATPEAIVLELIERLSPRRNATAGKAGRPAPAAGRGRALSGDAAREVVRERGRRTLGRATSSPPRHGRLQRGLARGRPARRAGVPRACCARTRRRRGAARRPRRGHRPALRAQARRLAARLFVRAGRLGARRRPRLPAPDGRAPGRRGDLDLERTLERAGGRPRHAEDIVTRRWTAPLRALCLLIDHSGSMRGHAVGLAAMAAAAVVLTRNERVSCSVIAFAADALVLQRQGAPRPPAAAGRRPAVAARARAAPTSRWRCARPRASSPRAGAPGAARDRAHRLPVDRRRRPAGRTRRARPGRRAGHERRARRRRGGPRLAPAATGASCRRRASPSSRCAREPPELKSAWTHLDEWRLDAPARVRIPSKLIRGCLGSPRGRGR